MLLLKGVNSVMKKAYCYNQSLTSQNRSRHGLIVKFPET